MAFPDLTLKTGGQLHSQATGQPVNGSNTFALAIPPAKIDNTDWLSIEVIPLGSSITGASFVSISGDKTQITVNFTQTGTDQATVKAEFKHTLGR